MRRGVQTLLLVMILPPRVAERIMLDSSTSAHLTIDADRWMHRRPLARGSTDDGRLRRQSQWPCGTGGWVGGRSAQTGVPTHSFTSPTVLVSLHALVASLCQPVAVPSQRSHWSGRSSSADRSHTQIHAALHCTQTRARATSTHVHTDTQRCAILASRFSSLVAERSGRPVRSVGSGSVPCPQRRLHQHSSSCFAA